MNRDQEINERRALAHTKSRISTHIAPFFGQRRIGDVTTTEIRADVVQREVEKAEAATISRALAIIRRALRLTHRAWHILTAAPRRDAGREPKREQGFF